MIVKTNRCNCLNARARGESVPAQMEGMGKGARRLLAGTILAITVAGCNTVTTQRYEATALTTYTWQVEYSINPASDKMPRRESFGSTFLLNRNGEKPEGATTGPDDKGLWWPALPPRPTVDEIENRLQKPLEKASSPQLQKTVEYKLSYQEGVQSVTLPTNYQVYRQAVKAQASGTPLELTLGVNDGSVEKAEPR